MRRGAIRSGRQAAVAPAALAGALLVALVAFPLPLHAGDGKVQHELRTYLQAAVNTIPAGPVGHGIQFAPFAKVEDRFRSGNLVLNKVFLGATTRFLPWLSFRTYYAHKDLFYAGHKVQHMAVGEVQFDSQFGPVRLLDRNGNEWFEPDAFYRYRNYFEPTWFTPVTWLSVWASEEFRYDSDQGRINMNDVRLGLGFRPRKALTIRAFADVEENRRGKPDWQRTDFLGIGLSATL